MLNEITTFGCEIQWAATKSAAIKAIADNKFDFCLINYCLGENTGIEVLREAVANGFRAPMILLTEKDDRLIDLEAMNAGAADYLFKGEIKAALLERTIRYALERKRAEEALSESTKRERAMIENALDVICTVDADGRFVTINPACFKMLGYLPEELIGRQYIELVVPEDVNKTREIAQNLMTGEVATNFENRYRHKNGTLVNLILTEILTRFGFMMSKLLSFWLLMKKQPAITVTRTKNFKT